MMRQVMEIDLGLQKEESIVAAIERREPIEPVNGPHDGTIVWYLIDAYNSGDGIGDYVEAIKPLHIIEWQTPRQVYLEVVSE